MKNNSFLDQVQDKSWIVNDNVVTDDRVREIVKEAIKIYDADKTGRVDYALESAGNLSISVDRINTIIILTELLHCHYFFFFFINRWSDY